MNLTPRALVTLLGSALLVMGAFSPIISMGGLGSISMISKDSWAGAIIIAAAVIGAIGAFLSRWPWLWYVAGAAAGTIALEGLQLSLSMQGMREAMAVDKDDGLAGAFGNLIASAIQPSWGLPILVIGALALFAAAAMRDESKRARTNERRAIHPVLGIALMLGLAGVGAALGQQERTTLVSKAKADAAKKAAEAKAEAERLAAEEKAQEEAAATEAKARQDAMNQLDFTDFQWESGEYSKYITGRLTNNSDRTIHDITLKFDLTDEYNNLVGDESDYVDELEPGQTYMVKTMVLKDSATSARFPEITGRAFEY